MDMENVLTNDTKVYLTIYGTLSAIPADWVWSSRDGRSSIIKTAHIDGKAFQIFCGLRGRGCFQSPILKWATHPSVQDEIDRQAEIEKQKSLTTDAASIAAAGKRQNALRQARYARNMVLYNIQAKHLKEKFDPVFHDLIFGSTVEYLRILDDNIKNIRMAQRGWIMSAILAYRWSLLRKGAMYQYERNPAPDIAFIEVLRNTISDWRIHALTEYDHLDKRKNTARILLVREFKKSLHNRWEHFTCHATCYPVPLQQIKTHGEKASLIPGTEANAVDGHRLSTPTKISALAQPQLQYFP